MDYEALFADVKTNPGKYELDGTFSNLSAFIQGCDASRNNYLLEGFREWLTVRFSEVEDLSWKGLILKSVTKSIESGDSSVGIDEVDKRGTVALFSLLSEFFERKRKEHGLRKVYDEYLAWLQDRTH